jgi:hypothetical protein
MLMKTDDVLYHKQTPDETITGQNLARAHRSVLELAFVGRDLNVGELSLIKPTVKQCAALAGVCVAAGCS